jgi:RNA polymerase sigma factor (TIGR02999 family)
LRSIRTGDTLAAMHVSPGTITAALAELRDDAPGAADRLVRLVIDDLHRLAEAAMRRESVGHTLQPTELVNEAFLRLLGGTAIEFTDRAHFFAIAAQTIRRLLVEHARRRHAAKRDAGIRVVLDDQLASNDRPTLELIALDDALQGLEQVAPRPARVVELRYFGGLSVEETAEVLKSSPATIKRDWSFARAFLLRALDAGPAPRTEPS